MASDIFDIDFQIQTENLITPTKRKPTTLDFMGSIAENLQYLRDNFLGDYRLGSAYPAYSGGTAYVPYDRVQWTDMGVYENIVASTGVDPSGMAASVATWRKLQDNYLGVNTRVQYNGQIIIFLSAVNAWFGVTVAPLIYLVNNNSAGLGFTLFVPVAVYNALGATNPDRERRFREFSDKYAVAGLVYQITTY